jgi:hypothetical protein
MIYPVKNLKTGEVRELRVSYEEYKDFLSKNPDFERIWTPTMAKINGKMTCWPNFKKK